jgi:peroxiredoxin
MKKIIFLFLIVPMISFTQNDFKSIEKKGIDTSNYIPKGLNIGDNAPLIEGISISRKKINSNEIIKEKEIVVIFYRGEWCPVCNRYLQNLNDSLEFILNKNAEVLVIGPETFENAEKIADKTKATFTLIPDTTLKILKDYDVLFNVTEKYQRKIKTFLRTDIAESNNQEEAQLPVPATYIIGKDGLIKWRHFKYDYSERASVKEILDHLK